MKLTLPQQDIYFEQLLYPQDPIYNIGAKIRIEGPLDLPAFQQAYQRLIEQHDTFRTIFSRAEDTVEARVLDTPIAPMPYLDRSAEGEAAVLDFMQAEFMKPFDLLGQEFLHRFILIKVGPELHYLFSVYHHIITDGWGTSLMFQRLVSNYNELLEAGAVTTAYPFSYSSFAEDDETYRQSAAYQEDLGYWQEKFRQLPENLFESLDRKTGKANRSARKELYVPREAYDQLNTISRQLGGTTFHLILALLFIYFSRRQGNRDFVIGLPVLNRGKAAFKKTVGLFMGVSLLRMAIDPAATLGDLVGGIRKQLREDYRHQRFPLGKLIQELQGFQEKDRLFNLTLSYEKQNYAEHFLQTHTSVIPLTHQAERVALAVYIREFDESEPVKIDFDYNLNYFDAETMAEVAAQFEHLLLQVLEAPDQPLEQYALLRPADEHLQLEAFNRTQQSLPPVQTLLDLIASTAKIDPGKTAVQDAQQSLIYQALDTLSEAVARCLLKREPAGLAVGVLLSRSVHTLAVLLGILKAGKSYIPLDPSFPGERLQYIQEHSGLSVIISDQADAESLFRSVDVLGLDTLLAEAESTTGGPELPAVAADQTAYIIYTSGSTGKPKGVEIGHRALLNFLWSMQQEPGLSAGDLLYAVTTYSFDISILEFFLPLISGATVYIADQETLDDYQQTIASIQEAAPTVIQATPSFFQLLVNGGWTGTKTLKLLCGGDLLSEELAGQLLQRSGELWNMYGPTETTIWSTIQRITLPEQAAEIGQPIANTQCYVLDAERQLLPLGSIGVLHIAGEGLAKGYFKAPELTSEKFVPNPFGAGRLYNTNDLVRWTRTGTLQFLGRNDNQVKIRGYRIELGDVEAQLHRLPEVRQAVVVACRQRGQEAFLAAYILPEQPDFEVQDCLPFLERQLPAYMVPRTLIPIDAFPLTPNKKIDRKALAQRPIQAMPAPATSAPVRSVLQEQLAGFWQEVLELSRPVGPADNFFALGGHSLNAVRLTERINTQLNYQIGLKAIFDYPTLEALSEYLAVQPRQQPAIPIAYSKALYALSPAQYHLWLAAQDPRRSVAYNMVAAFEVEGQLEALRLHRAMQRLLDEQEILRTNFVERDGQVYQLIRPADSAVFEWTSREVPAAQLQAAIQQYVDEPFDLEKDILLKMRLFRTESGPDTLVFCTHHLIMDGAALEIFTQNFLANYQAEALSQPNHEPQLQFKDYSEWLIAQAPEPEALDFWQRYLKDYERGASMQPDREVPTGEGPNGAFVDLAFTPEETEGLRRLARRFQSTPHNVLAALLHLAVYQLTDREDHVIGTVNSARNRPGLYPMIGMLVKSLPLRLRLDVDQDFEAMVRQVQQHIAELDRYQDVPEAMRRETFFDLIMTYQDTRFSLRRSMHLEGVVLHPITVETSYSRIPLQFNFFEVESVLHLRLSYDCARYEEGTADFLVGLLRRLLVLVAEAPEVPVGKLGQRLLSAEQQQEELDFDLHF